MSFLEKMAVLLGRVAFGWFFLVQALNYLGNWDNTLMVMALAHISGAPFVLAVTLLLLTMGSISLIFGYHARYGALILFVITVSAALIINDWWRIAPDSAEHMAARAAKFELFACYAAISGALLMLVGLGPGPIAVDNAGKGGKR